MSESENEESEVSTEFLPLKTAILTEELQLKSQDKLGETEENVRQGLVALRDFIEDEGLPVPKDDYFLLMFLRGRKFRLIRAQETLRRYVSLQAYLLEAASMDFDRLRNVLDHKVIGLLPYRDEEGRVIFILRAGIWSPEICDIEDARKCLLLLGHFAMQFPPTSVSGFRLLFDADMKSMSELFHYAGAAKIVLSQLGCYPIRIQKVDFINESGWAQFIIKTLGYMLPKRAYDMFEMHGTDKQSLYTSIHPSILPEEFWGTLPTISCDSYVDDFKEFLEKFKEEINAIHRENISLNEDNAQTINSDLYYGEDLNNV